MAISASDVKALREKTGAGMMDCKKALEECGGDEAAAIKLLKEKGLAAMQKRADRATDEGCFFLAKNDGGVAIAELTCETDFVAKNEDFIACGEKIAQQVLENKKNAADDSLTALVTDVATKTRENMALKRVAYVEIPADCAAASYIHSDKKTVAVTLLKVDPASAKDNEAVKQLAYDCCLHLAAFTPAYVKKEDVSQAYLDEQREIFASLVAEQMADKPENVQKNAVEGKLNKLLKDICFMDQMFVKDDKMSVEKKIAEVANSCGAKITVEKAVHFVLGK
ncbi:MAG: translation elongation factor Ts [Spirochaetaceae bacterium]|nr:translation elongation factor Ts [Spirochaetaceae bacterium]